MTAFCWRGQVPNKGREHMGNGAEQRETPQWGRRGKGVYGRECTQGRLKSQSHVQEGLPERDVGAKACRLFAKSTPF